MQLPYQPLPSLTLWCGPVDDIHSSLQRLVPDWPRQVLKCIMQQCYAGT